MKTCLPILLALFTLGRLAAQDTTLATGRSTVVLRNTRDIHHPRNDEARRQLMARAVEDAILLATGTRVRSVTELQVSELRTMEGGRFDESFDERTVLLNEAAWRRTSEYRFQRTPGESRRWTCSVEGLVWTTGGPAAGAGLEVPTERIATTVGARTGNRWLLHTGSAPPPEVGERFLVRRPGNVNERGTRMVVTGTEGDVARARLISGTPPVPGETIVPAGFGLLRGGFRMRYGWLGTATSTEGAATSTWSMSVQSFEQSLVSGNALAVGMTLIVREGADEGGVQSMLLGVEAGRSLELLREGLAIMPTLQAGIALMPSEDYPSEAGVGLFGEVGAELQLDLGALRFGAGITARAVTDGTLPAAVVPRISLELDLYRATRTATGDRHRPEPLYPLGGLAEILY